MTRTLLSFFQINTILVFFFLAPNLNAQCGAGESYHNACYADNESNTVVFEVCPSAGMAAEATITAGSFQVTDNLTIYEGATGSGTSGTIYFGPQNGNLSGTVITGGIADRCLIFVVNSDVVISCDSGFEAELEVCGKSIPAGTVQFLKPDDVCINDGVQTGLGGGLPHGGVYSGNGVTDDGNGMTFTFDPPAAGANNHTLTYVNGASATADLEVFAIPSVTFTTIADLCIDAGIQTGLGGGSPAGGVYSGPGVTDDGNGMTYSFNPGIAGLGVHTIVYTEETVCMITAMDDVEVLAACSCPVGQDVYFYCYDNNESNLVIFEVCPTAGMAAEATITDGIYTSYADQLTVYQGLSGSGTSGTIVAGPLAGNLAGTVISGNLADHCLIFVSLSDFGLSCKDGDAPGLVVCAESIGTSVVFTAPDDLCVSDGVQNGLSGGSPTGGVYSGVGVSDDGNGMTYSFDPATAGVGVHTIAYTQGGSTATDDIEVFALPAVSFMALSDLCIDAGSQSNLGGGTPIGGVYSGPGVSDDGNGLTYTFNPGLAGLGTHTITYTEGNCSVSSTDNVEVLAACGCPMGESSYFYCYGNNESNTVFFEVCPSAGMFAEAEINQGTIGSLDQLRVYQGVSGSGTAGTIVLGPINGNLAGTIINGTTADECLIFVGTSDPVASCADGFELSMMVCGRSNANNVTFTALSDLSVNAGIQTGLNQGLPTGGVYSGPGVTDDGNGMTYTFNPAVAGIGVHTLTYTIGGDSASDDVEVFNLLPPSFSKSFNPTTMGSGAISTLTFTINNTASGTPLSGIDFTDNLPAGMTVAAAPNINQNCFAGTVTAIPGATSISFSSGELTGNSSCTISVNVTTSTAGTSTNTTGDLTSSAGNSGTASANLTIDGNCPVFTKSFSPATVNLGEKSTLTFTIDNTAGAVDLNSAQFVDNLPVGMEVASPANVSISCMNGLLTAVPGSSVITYAPTMFGQTSVSAGSSCTISVDVVATGTGSLANITENFNVRNNLFQQFNCGFAGASLEVLTPPEISIQKSFSLNPVAPGGTTDLEFTLTNRSRDFAAENVTFTDDLTAVLAGLTATGTPLNDVCGIGSQLSGTTLLTFSGGTIPAGGSCTFSVPLQVPGGAASGTYTNTTGVISADFNGSNVLGNSATRDLNVAYVPTITKTFLNNPIPAGGITSVEFTITNNSPTTTLTDVTFSDVLDDFIGGTTVSASPAAGSCGTGSLFIATNVNNKFTFQMIGGQLAAGASCTFTVDFLIPQGTGAGTYTNTTGFLSGKLGASSVDGFPSSDDLEVLALPRLSKSFSNDPVQAGQMVNLEFTLTYDAFASGDATSIAFTDDLNAVIPGLTAVGLPLNDICGTGSQISGTTNLSFTGGTLSPGGDCTFSVPVMVPAGVSPGIYTNTTSTLSVTVGGQVATGSAATDDLVIAGMELSKEFIDDPVIPGDLVTLRYTLDNTSTFDATSIVFTDNFSGVIPGLVAEAPLPSMPCGPGASAFGTTFFIYTGGAVSAGTSCSFDVMVRVPASAANGNYGSTTSNLSAIMDGATLSLGTATDVLMVDKTKISLTKTFTNDPVLPGGTVDVEYTLVNLDATNPITNVAFTDDFDGVLSGLAATALPMNDICGLGSQVSGTGLLSFSGGTLAAGASCSFTVTLQVPVTAVYGANYTSTTSDPVGTLNSFTVMGDAATDDLKIQALRFSQAFTGPVDAGGTATLTYTLINDDPVNPISDITFNSDLDAFISGLTATNLPLSDICGTGSGLSGTSVINFGRGTLNPGQTCSFDVEVMVPCETPGGNYSKAIEQVSGLSSLLLVSAEAAATSLAVTGADIAALTAPADLCMDDGIQSNLSGGTPIGGVYSGLGVSDDGNGMTYTFNPMTVGAGIHEILYNYVSVGSCPSEDADSVTVFAVPANPVTLGDTINSGFPVLTGLTASSSDCITTPSQSGTTTLTLMPTDLPSVNFSFTAPLVVSFDMASAGIPVNAIVKDGDANGTAVSVSAVTGNAFAICFGSDGEDANLEVVGPDLNARESNAATNLGPGPWTIGSITSAAFDDENARGNWRITFSDSYDDPYDCFGMGPENEITGPITLTIEWEVPAVTAAPTFTWWNAPTGGIQQGMGSPFNPTGTIAEEGPVDLNTPGDYTFYLESNCECLDGRLEVVFQVVLFVPLELLSFDGYQQGSVNILEWVTSTEQNTSHFIVERSRNGIDFNAVGDPVLAAEFSNQEKSYSFKDRTPFAGTNYYRLKMLDQDGSFEYSELIQLDLDAGKEEVIRIIPNPVKEEAVFSVQGTYREWTKVQVLDIFGRVVLAVPLEVTEGTVSITMDLGGLPSGLYFVKTESSQFEKALKFVKE